MKHFVMAHRTANSVLGAASSPLLIDGKVALYDTHEEASVVIQQLNSTRYSSNVYYTYGGIYNKEI